MHSEPYKVLEVFGHLLPVLRFVSLHAEAAVRGLPEVLLMAVYTQDIWSAFEAIDPPKV
jgi:hypothetical protein